MFLNQNHMFYHSIVEASFSATMVTWNPQEVPTLEETYLWHAPNSPGIKANRRPKVPRRWDGWESIHQVGLLGSIQQLLLFAHRLTVELSPLTRCVWATKAWRNLVGMERIGASKIPGMIDGLFGGLHCCTSIYSGKLVIIGVQRPHIDLTVISGRNHPLCGLYISGLGIV